MKIYNKLVRDNIPEIIQQNKQIPKTRILSDQAYAQCLIEKLREEVEEFIHDKNGEELADILEVIYACASTLGLTADEVEALRSEKARVRGTFQKRIYLESVEDIS